MLPVPAIIERTVSRKRPSVIATPSFISKRGTKGYSHLNFAYRDKCRFRSARKVGKCDTRDAKPGAWLYLQLNSPLKFKLAPNRLLKFCGDGVSVIIGIK